MRLIAWRGTLPQKTHPPNGSLIGIPSASTTARLAPLAPTPRSDPPCEVGFAVRLPDLRNNEKPGIWRSASSTVREAVVERSSLDNTAMLAAVMLTRVSVRDAVTVIC